MKKILEMLIEFIRALFSAKPIENNNNEEDTVITEVDNQEITNSNEEAMESTEEPIVAAPVNTKIKILIDNGHGKETPGKKSPYSAHKTKPAIPFEEWEWNREIAIMVENRLKDMGYDVQRIVTEDSDVSLAERVNRVNKVCSQVGKNNVVFVSVHANAAGDGKNWLTGKGWSAYTTRGITKSDTFAEYFYDAAESHWPDRKIRKDMSDGDRDQEADFYVIKKTACAAVLTENFFYDNVDDVQYILSDEGKEQVTQVHVEAISKYVESLK